VTTFLSGGTLGTRYAILGKITTAGGRINDFTFNIVITLAALPSTQ